MRRARRYVRVQLVFAENSILINTLKKRRSQTLRVFYLSTDFLVGSTGTDLEIFYKRNLAELKSSFFYNFLSPQKYDYRLF